MIEPRWRPPASRPLNESAGYLGYYCRTFLPFVFDIVNDDNCWPAVWFYRKREARPPLARIIEEKLENQELRESEWGVYGLWADLLDDGVVAGKIHPDSGIYIIWDAERLAVPTFPIRVQRYRGECNAMEKLAFDAWLLCTEPIGVGF